MMCSCSIRRRQSGAGQRGRANQARQQNTAASTCRSDRLLLLLVFICVFVCCAGSGQHTRCARGADDGCGRRWSCVRVRRNKIGTVFPLLFVSSLVSDAYLFMQLNDLWMINASSVWTWTSGCAGPSITYQYGAKGTAVCTHMHAHALFVFCSRRSCFVLVQGAANYPPERYAAGLVTDAQGRVWLFGGSSSAQTGLIRVLLMFVRG